MTISMSVVPGAAPTKLTMREPNVMRIRYVIYQAASTGNLTSFGHHRTCTTAVTGTHFLQQALLVSSRSFLVYKIFDTSRRREQRRNPHGRGPIAGRRHDRVAKGVRHSPA